MISWAGWWIQTPSATPLQLNKWNAHFWIMFNIWWWAGLIDGLKPHPPPLSSQKMKCWLLDYVYLLMIRQAGQWTWAPSNTHQPKEWNAHFWITFTSVDGLGWLIDSNPICHPSPAKKMKCSFLDYVHFCWWSGLVDRLQSHLPPLSSQNDEMPIFVLCWTSNNQPGCSMDSNPIHYPSPAKIMRCLFLHYIQLLIISWAGQWTWIPSATSLQPKKWNAHFWITFNFWWSVGLVNGFEPCPPPLSS